MEQSEPMPSQVVPTVRRYHCYERGLESKERAILASAKMKRFVEKMSRLYNVQFRVPDFLPVFVSKRLKKYGGLHYSSKIVVEYGNASSSWASRDVLWHECVHSFIDNNWLILQQSNPNITWKDYKPFERNAFRIACNDGSHGSYNWKLTCDCGYWWKSVKKREEKFCPKCIMYVVSPTEFIKLKKIAAIGSKKFHIDITKYKPWKSNEGIE
jgi:hypothetical protein